jgi:hypothetical protein
VFQRQLAEDDLFDGFIGEHALGQQSGCFVVAVSPHPILAKRAGASNLQAEVAHGPLAAQRHGIHHAGLTEHLDQRDGPFGIGDPCGDMLFAPRRFIRLRRNFVAVPVFDDGVGQQLDGNAFEVAVLKVAFDQEGTGAVDFT